MSYVVVLDGGLAVTPPPANAHRIHLDAFGTTLRVRRAAALTATRVDNARSAVGLAMGDEGGYPAAAGDALVQGGGGPLFDPGGPTAPAVGRGCFERAASSQHPRCHTAVLEWPPSARRRGRVGPEETA